MSRWLGGSPNAVEVYEDHVEGIDRGRSDLEPEDVL
jgi:hypothetical protein